MSWEQLSAGVELPFADDLVVPELFPYPLDVPSPPAVGDIEGRARDAALNAFRDTVTAGMTIAVGAGSRGLTGRVELLRGTIAALRELGAEPFVVPAMGSHGGATAEGQVHLLAELGITEASLGVEIRATMDTVVVAHTDSGTPVHLDAHAAAADRFLPVNRIKPHTCFKGPIESGCMKMAVVGFGKQPGAALVHSCGPIEMRDRLLDACAALRRTGRLLGGIASIESTAGDVVRIEALGADDVGTELEHELTEYARGLVPALPFDEIDVLIIELGGKDISGTTIDPNVTGRFWVSGLDDLQKPVRGRDRAARADRDQRRQRARDRVRRLHPGLARQPARLPQDLHQLLHGRSGRHAAGTPADGAARRAVVHPRRTVDVRPRSERTQAGRADSFDPAPHRVLGQRDPVAVVAIRQRFPAASLGGHAGAGRPHTIPMVAA